MPFFYCKLARFNSFRLEKNILHTSIFPCINQFVCPGFFKFQDKKHSRK